MTTYNNNNWKNQNHRVNGAGEGKELFWFSESNDEEEKIMRTLNVHHSIKINQTWNIDKIWNICKKIKGTNPNF